MKLNCDELLVHFVHNPNLRLDTEELDELIRRALQLFSRHPPVGRCRLTVSKPVLKAAMDSVLEARI